MFKETVALTPRGMCAVLEGAELYPIPCSVNTVPAKQPLPRTTEFTQGRATLGLLHEELTATGGRLAPLRFGSGWSPGLSRAGRQPSGDTCPAPGAHPPARGKEALGPGPSERVPPAFLSRAALPASLLPSFPPSLPATPGGGVGGGAARAGPGCRSRAQTGPSRSVVRRRRCPRARPWCRPGTWTSRPTTRGAATAGSPRARSAWSSCAGSGSFTGRYAGPGARSGSCGAGPLGRGRGRARPPLIPEFPRAPRPRERGCRHDGTPCALLPAHAWRRGRGSASRQW